MKPPTSFSVRPTGAAVTAAPFFVPGRAEKPQEPRPPPRTQGPRPSPHAPHGMEWTPPAY